ncbi:zinc finger RNA-binding protein-like isoform X2 [Penaeus monodon]|uniref:zinc finger RNA-binding protein-like isoform X2 n=1 Tax=Penaeus monodon TaxID=6687 RepID=UPI0018A703C5|nr:zinc finger RNA-binding protein-like isoform X2 [Penaeus monodon]
MMSVCTTQITYSTTNSVPVAVQEGLLIRQVLGEQEFYECVVCHSSMSGIVPAKSHLEGSRHLRTLRNMAYTSVLTSCANLNISRDGPDLSCSNQDLSHAEATFSCSDNYDEIATAMKRGIISEKCVNRTTFFECNVCNIMCTGTASVSEHLQGDQHNKRLRRQEHPKEKECRVVDIPDSKFGKVISDEELIERRIFNGALHYHCRLCNSSCTGEENLNQHLTGRQHLKARRNRNFGDPAAAFQTNSPASRQTGAPCTPVQTNIQDQVTYDRLMAERAADGYYCNVCNISCTGKENFDQHERGRQHQKTLNKVLMGGRVSATPTTSRVNVSPYRQDAPQVPPSPSVPVAAPVYPPPTRTEENKSKDLVQQAVENGYMIETDVGYFCLMCEITCTGIVPVTDHLTGDTHQRNLQQQIILQKSMIAPDKSCPAPGTTSNMQERLGRNIESLYKPPSPPRFQLPYTRSMSRHASPLQDSLQDIKVYPASEPLDNLFE